MASEALVTALHFGGRYLVGNVSVPLGALTKDLLIRKRKLSYS